MDTNTWDWKSASLDPKERQPMEPACQTSEPAFLKRRTPWNTLSARVLSLVSRKGGVGKTTSAVNLGAAFALSGHSVLIIGVDPQCGVAGILAPKGAARAEGLLDLYDHDLALTDLAQTSPLKELFFVSPQVASLKDETRFLKHLQDQPDLFVQQVDRARNLYDTIIIDCPPHLGAPTLAALQASDGVLVPVQAEELCRDSLGTLLGALDTFNEARGSETMAGGPELEGIFLTMLSEQTRMGRHVAARVAEEFGPVLLETAVPRTIRLSEMALRGKPSVIYDRRSSGSRAYFNLADEILQRYLQREGLTGDEDGDQPAASEPLEHEDQAPALRMVQPQIRPGAGNGYSLVGGLDRLLGDLRAQGCLELPSAPQADELAAPDMVSLEDLLAEEEAGQDGSWQRPWSEDEDGPRRPN